MRTSGRRACRCAGACLGHARETAMSKPVRPPRLNPRELSPRRNQPTILCIDGDRSALAKSKAILQSAGYQVFTANSGSIGLEIAKTKHLDLALVDFAMPDMSSYAIAALLRATQPGTRILLVSAFGPAPGRMNGELDGVLIKGQPTGRFLERIANQLAGTKPRTLSWDPMRDAVA